MTATTRGNNGFALVAKLFHSAHRNKRVEALHRTLGLDLHGNDSFADTTKPNQMRKFSPILGEGVAAVSMGHVSQIVLGIAVQNPGTVSFRIAPDAYTQSMAVPGVPTRDVIAGFWGTAREAFTSIRSTSANAAPDQGKTEISLFPSMLAWAADAHSGGNSDGIGLLVAWLEWVKQLKAIGELPITGTSSAVRSGLSQAQRDTLTLCVRRLADEAYELIQYGLSTNSLSHTPPPNPITAVKLINLRAPVGWTATGHNEDASPLFLDPVAFEAFLNDRVYPRSIANANTAAANQAASQAAQAQQAAREAEERQRLAEQQRRAAERARRAEQRRERRRQAAETTFLPEIDGPQFATYPWLRHAYRAGRVCMPAGGCYATLLVGPAGTLKTSSIFALADGMPTIKLSVASQSEVPLLLGDYGRDHNGQWVPRLGIFARAVRASMLAAFCVALKREGKIEGTLAQHQGHQLCSILEKLAGSPGDPDARNELDRAAFPYFPEGWAIFQQAYFEAGAHTIGPTVRIFFDEIHDAADNPSLETLLKVAFEDARQVMLSAAGAGWYDLAAPNCQFVAAGNPDEATRRGSQFGRAMRSRFGFTLAVGYPAKLMEEEIALSATLDAGPLFPRPPADLSLANFKYEPIPWQSKPITTSASKTIREFAQFTRDELTNGTIPESLDVRGTVQIARTAAYLLSVGKSPRQAFLDAVEPVLTRLSQADELGLPLDHDVAMLRQKAVSLAGANHL